MISKKIRYVIPLFLFVITTTGFSQTRKPGIFIGAGPSLFTGTMLPSKFGAGAGISWQSNRNKKWKMTAGIEYVRFRGNVITPYLNSVLEGFSVMPVTLGIKYLPAEQIYFSCRGGMAIGLRHAGNHPCISPGAGIELPAFKNNVIDIGLHFVAVTRSSSIPENHLTYRGGYHYMNLRIGLGL